MSLLDSHSAQVDAGLITFSEELSFANADDLIGQIEHRVAQRTPKVVLDLANVGLLDSSGLRAILSGRRRCEEAGVSFELASVSDYAARIIEIAGLTRFFKLDSEANIPGSEVEQGSVPEYSEEGRRTQDFVAVSDPSVIPVLREQVTQAALEAGASGELLCDIQIAVGEALTNAYKHGSPRKGHDRIQVRCITCPNALVVEVEDAGEPFDPDGASPPDPRELKSHGMGIYLMRQAMDVVEFRSGCPGNRVRMIKCRT